MTPRRLGALMSLWLAGFPDEASGQPPGAVKLTEPFKQPPAPPWLTTGQATLPKIELIPPFTPAPADEEERCQEGEPARKSVPPEPTHMDRFPTGQVALRWRVPPTGMRPALLYVESSREVDLVRCATLQAQRLEKPPPAPAR
jgi:hypothetical protein